MAEALVPGWPRPQGPSPVTWSEFHFEGSAKVQTGAELLCKSERHISGLGSRPSGTGTGSAFHPGPAPVPDNPYQIPEGRDLGPENAFRHPPPENISHFCTFAQAAGRFAHLHLGRHVVPSLPKASTPPILHTLGIHVCPRTARGAVPTPSPSSSPSQRPPTSPTTAHTPLRKSRWQPGQGS